MSSRWTYAAPWNAGQPVPAWCSTGARCATAASPALDLDTLRLLSHASPTCSHLPVPQAGHGPWMLDVRISKTFRKSCSARFSSAYRPELTCANVDRLTMINDKYITSLAASQSPIKRIRAAATASCHARLAYACASSDAERFSE